MTMIDDDDDDIVQLSLLKKRNLFYYSKLFLLTKFLSLTTAQILEICNIVFVLKFLGRFTEIVEFVIKLYIL